MSGARPDAPSAVRIEAENEWAWCGARRLRLTPRAFAVLRHLVERQGRLVTKHELLGAVWRDAIVSDAALASSIRDLRKALEDPSGAPRYIQTVHRRGFRFIGPVAAPTAVVAPPGSATSGVGPHVEPPGSVTSSSSSAPASTLVGREAALGRLHESLGKALGGQRQLVFVTGEPGIGKTALVERFLAEVGNADALRVGRGQCVEQYGAGEPYLPVLEGVGRLGRAADGERLVQILLQHAPTWLEQLPGLLSDRDVEAVQRRAQGATRGRMLRELAEALDALTRDTPLVLLLEDLHWSDSATIDLLSMLARRRDPSRLLVIGTYRPADVAAAAHPLRWVKHELQLHGDCDEIPLEFLSAPAVSEYLSRRFPGHGLPAELALVLHRNTDGNPLFLVNTVDYLIGQGQLREIDGQWQLSGRAEDVAARVPETLRQLVETQMARLTADEQTVLMAASVAGAEFSAAAAVASGIDPEQGERLCEALARRGQFLRRVGVAEWPDGTVAGRYAFIHVLFQQALYERACIGERVRLHLLTAERLERGYGERAAEIAGELAVHFEHGRQFERAARYRGEAGEHALRQHAYREAADHATRGLDALRTSPDSRERAQQELSLQVTLGVALTATQGFAAPEVVRAYARAWELCAQVGETPQLPSVLGGVGRFYILRGEFQTARDVGTRLLVMAEATADAALLQAAHNALGVVSVYAGDFAAALDHLERGIERHDLNQHSPAMSPAFRLVPSRVTCAIHAAWALWMLGYPDRAVARIQEALTLARSIDHPFSLSYTCHLAAGLHRWRREYQAVRELEDEASTHDTEHGFELLLTAGVVHRGWLLAERGEGEEGLAQIREGLARHREIGATVLVPAFLALMAEVYQKLGRPAEGLSAVTEALMVARQSGQHFWEAELHRLTGVLTVQTEASRGRGAGDGESHFLQAIAVARRQGARSLELRAAMSLSRLWADKGKVREGHALLSRVYAWFTEGFDTADLKETRSLLETLETRAGGRPARPR
jgi:DNA-binding winged helix-turn-helix (wHTH) protein/predicted ATPase